MSQLVFKSEEERIQAYDNIPDIEEAPIGVKMEDYREEMEKKLEDIDNAVISEDGTLPEGMSSDDLADPPADEEIVPPVQNDIPDNTEDRVAILERERKEMMARFEQEKAELTGTINELKEAPVKKEEEIVPPPSNNTDLSKKEDEINDIQGQINELEEAMNDIDDPFDEDVQRAMLKTHNLSSRLNRLMAEKYNMELADNRAELNKLKKKQSEETEKLQKKQEEDNAQKVESESRRKTLSMVEQFQKKPEFKSSKTFEEMEDEYANFSLSLAIADTGKDAIDITSEDSEKAVSRYLDKTPLLLEKARQNQIKEPADMREFLVLSDVNALRMGVQLDKRTGKWKQLLSDDNKQINFPDLDSAYDYYKKVKGITGQQLLDAERLASQNALDAVSQRANMKELDDAHQAHTIDDMDMDAASKIVEEWNEEEVIELARRDMSSKKVQMYNKALMTMGLDPIEEGF